jgi:hypothetical protein
MTLVVVLLWSVVWPQIIKYVHLRKSVKDDRLWHSVMGAPHIPRDS